MEKYINPFTDFGFKKLFGIESDSYRINKELLIDFLNQILSNRESIKDLTYLNTENLGNSKVDRKAVFDLYCENEIGEKFIIEIQNVKQHPDSLSGLRTEVFSIRRSLSKVKHLRENLGIFT